MGRPRPRARRTCLARGSREPQAGDAIRALHAGVHDPRHLADAAQDGLRWRPRSRARLRNGPLLRPRAGSPDGQARADRRRDGPHDGPDRKTPLSERAHPTRGFHQGAASRRLRPRDRQPAVLGPHRARRRSSRRAPPFPARLFHCEVDRTVAARRPRRLRHLALDHGQDRSHRPRAYRRHGGSHRRGAPSAGRNARRGRNGRRGRHPCSCKSAMRERRPGGAAWDSLAEAVPAEDGDPALSINRYFVDHPEMVLGGHARTSSAYGPVYTCLPVLATDGALEDQLSRALDRLPRDLFTPASDVHWRNTRRRIPVRVGTAAEGATIKEGSYLVHRGRPGPDHRRVAAAGRRPRGQGDRRHTRKARANHPRPDRRARCGAGGSARPGRRPPVGIGADPVALGLCALRSQLRPDQPDHDQRDGQRRGRDAGDLPPPQPSALPRRSRRLARRLDRGLRSRKRNRETGPDLPRARASSRDHAADRDGRGRARRHAARDRRGRSRPHRRASRPFARDRDRGTRRAHLSRPGSGRRPQQRRLGHGRRLSLGQNPRPSSRPPSPPLSTNAIGATSPRSKRPCPRI